jgi:L-cystine transport system permease protein
MRLDYEFMIETFRSALGGIPITFEITLVALIFAIPIGFFIAVACTNKVPLLSRLFKIYISFIRGTPFILQIFLVYNIFPSVLKNAGVDIFSMNPIVYAFIVFSISETAILAEVFRSALLTVDRGQLEAAQSIGMTRVQGYRRIVIPQAMKAALPVLTGSITTLIKNTSLVFSMSVMEITAIAKTAASARFAYIEAYIVIFAIYFVLIFIVDRSLNFFEKRGFKYA